MVKHLLEQGVLPHQEQGGVEDYHVEFCKTLIDAVKHGNTDIVRLLLEHGADPNRLHAPDSPLMVAVRKGWFSVAETLFAAGAGANDDSPPPIVLAVLKENMDMFRLLRRHGARLDTADSGGLAMTVAVHHGLQSMVDVLEHEGVERDMILQSGGVDDRGDLD
ncbi:hypothetical protein PG994_008490 [Apiospora phragmitis]|uniref:Ankyrin repeat domain-containing protein n=1 Tax=Apiospora phragmitis TaxID=2905665 RepID=A0ABR1UH46_9PEZI